MTRLIVSEKDIAAKRIAQLLATGTVTTEKIGTVPSYRFKVGAVDNICMGLKGHILQVDFPERYANWQAIEPQELIGAELIKKATQKGLVAALRKAAKLADEVVIATDFDREGELIGLDAANEVRKATGDKVSILRARFSALTDGEVKQAFAHLEAPDTNLAYAGEARQDIDLIWGATLTRFISLASTRLGKQFLSVGRVQSPTLALVVDRETERKAFKAEDYWVIKAVFERDGESFTAVHKTERFDNEEAADTAFGHLNGKDTQLPIEGIVTQVKRTTRKSLPPAPFNTTALLSAAASIGISPSSAMRTAESLYMGGYTSYPRVDNTVYPVSLDLREILGILQGAKEFAGMAKEIAAQKDIVPTRGKKQATDHPPIHPTGVPPAGKLSEREWKVYELIVRRFLATLSTAAEIETVRVDVEASGEPFFARGSRLIKEGWQRYYHYSRKKDEEMPALNKDDLLVLRDPSLEKKETQPPGRFSQSSLIVKMEDLGLGTKATRHNIIQNLYDRGYMHSDPIIPTELGVAVSIALQKHANTIASPEMTAELEREMDAIAAGSKQKDEVVDHSRQLLTKTMLGLVEHRDELGQEIRAGIAGGQTLGACPNCVDGTLRIIRSKKTKKRFVGCSGYPDCTTTYPLPQFGNIIPQAEKCPHCGAPVIKVISKGKRPWELCIDPNCPSKEEYNAKRAKRA